MNNPYKKQKYADRYDKALRSPIVNLIRRQETAVLAKLFREYLHNEDSALEIGAGTGYYTFDIAEQVKTLVALEPASAMYSALEQKVAASGIKNIALVNNDLLSYQPAQQYNHVIAIGVLDYIKDWKAFLDKCLALARKTVLVTMPQKGLWTCVYTLVSKLEGTTIYTYRAEQFTPYRKKYALEIYEAGLRSMLTSGHTLVALIKKS